MVLSIVGLVTTAFATIIFDAVSSTASSGKVSSLTWSHTVGSGSDRILVVAVELRKNDQSVSSIMYGGVGGFVQAGSQVAGGHEHRVDIWYKLAPAVGTANIVVTLAGGTVESVGGAMSFFNVDQSTPMGTFAGTSGDSTTPSISLSSTTGDVVVDAVSSNGDSSTVTAGSGQTQRWNLFSGTGDGNEFGAGSTKAGATSVTMSWTLTNANKWAIAAVPIKPGPTPTSLIGVRTNFPAKFYFSGEAYPNATVALDLLDERHNLLRNITSQMTDYAGKFFIYIDEHIFGPHLYGFTLRDRTGKILGAKFYNYEVKANLVIRQSIIFPPTVELNRTLLAENEDLIISGHGAPNRTVQVLEGAKVIASTQVGNGSEYSVTVPLGPGKHWLGVRQGKEEGAMSDLSELRLVTVGQAGNASIDLNVDGRVDIADWSIFLFNWSSPNETTRLKDDLNGDGIVDVSDFSVFLSAFADTQ